MLPDFDGPGDAAHLFDVPVTFTAKDALEDRIGGLTAGGDDYVTKPFSARGAGSPGQGLLRRTGATTVRPDHSRWATWCSTRTRTK